MKAEERANSMLLFSYLIPIITGIAALLAFSKLVFLCNESCLLLEEQGQQPKLGSFVKRLNIYIALSQPHLQAKAGKLHAAVLLLNYINSRDSSFPCIFETCV